MVEPMVAYWVKTYAFWNIPNSYVSITGVAGNEISNLKLAQVAALVDTMADGPIILIRSMRTTVLDRQST